MNLNSQEPRFVLKQTIFGFVKNIKAFSSIEEAYPWFVGLQMALRQLEEANGVAGEFNDNQSFLVWDTSLNNVAYHDGKYLTTYLLK